MFFPPPGACDTSEGRGGTQRHGDQQESWQGPGVHHEPQDVRHTAWGGR